MKKIDLSFAAIAICTSTVLLESGQTASTGTRRRRRP
jgi:hypothetical protein